jgi:hypothetical protein
MSTIRIVVLQRGWVVVGRVAEESATELRLENAAVIRRWGTTRGLGQIAINGPTDETVLDPCGVVRAHPLAVVMQIDAREEKWSGRI